MKLDCTIWSTQCGSISPERFLLPGTGRSILPGSGNGTIAQEIVASILRSHEERLLPHNRPDMPHISPVQKQVTTLASLPHPGKPCVVEEDFRRTRSIRSIFKV